MNMLGSRNIVGKKIDDYILVDILGTGAFGQVFQAQNLTSKDIVAIKSVPKTKLREHNGMVGQLLKTEVSILMQCSNPNVVKMMKYLESENNCYLVMEYCNQGDLEQLWKKKAKRIPEHEAVQFLKQMLNGMRALHEMNVIHRDLKLPNILISNGILKIGDLGFAKRLDDREQQVREALGTLGTMAPEVIEFKPYGILADMFSLGAIYYQLLFGILPFSIKSYDDFLKDVKSTQPHLSRDGIQISDHSKDILIRMLQYDPKQRLKWNEIYDHPLFSDQKQIFGNFNQKITVSDIAAVQVNIKQNKEVYKQNLNQFEEINNQNMMDKVKQRQGLLQEKQIVEQEQTPGREQIEYAQNQVINHRVKGEELNYAIECYIAERNTLVFLGTLLHEIHTQKHSQNVNVYLPAFFVVKKLMIEIHSLLDKIKKQQNIFDCKHFIELYAHPSFKNFHQLLEQDLEVIRDYFNIIQKQNKQIFQNMNQPNPVYVNELEAAPTVDFNQVFKEVLFNYYFQLQEERDHTRDMVRNKITNLLIYVLDAIAYDKKTRETVKYEIDNYFEQFNFMDEKEKDDIIGRKFAEAYS